MTPIKLDKTKLLGFRIGSDDKGSLISAKIGAKDGQKTAA